MHLMSASHLLQLSLARQVALVEQNDIRELDLSQQRNLNYGVWIMVSCASHADSGHTPQQLGAAQPGDVRQQMAAPLHV